MSFSSDPWCKQSQSDLFSPITALACPFFPCCRCCCCCCCCCCSRATAGWSCAAKCWLCRRRSLKNTPESCVPWKSSHARACASDVVGVAPSSSPGGPRRLVPTCPTVAAPSRAVTDGLGAGPPPTAGSHVASTSLACDSKSKSRSKYVTPAMARATLADASPRFVVRVSSLALAAQVGFSRKSADCG